MDDAILLSAGLKNRKYGDEKGTPVGVPKSWGLIRAVRTLTVVRALVEE